MDARAHPSRPRLLARSLLLVAAAAGLVGSGQPGDVMHPLPEQAPSPAIPPFECTARVGYDRDMDLPGYILPTKAGRRTCVPFASALYHPPKGYAGDYYVDEFTDRKLRAAWEACEKDKRCRKRVFKQVLKRHPPNHEYNLTDPHARYLLGKIDEQGNETDLGQIRRPRYFARDPYREAIAAADPSTSIVEFTVPAEPYERINRKGSGEVQIRGWYIRGRGVDDGTGTRRRALIVASGGGGDRVTAIDDPRDTGYEIEKDGETEPHDDWPNQTTGAQGQRYWRQAWASLHDAGFDVLALDRRGIGISGGYSDTNTLQQGHDLLDVVAQLRGGKGMRALLPDGTLLAGKAAADAVHGGSAGEGQPTFFLGSSRGTMASGWAMAINFDKDCRYDEPKIVCRPARADPTIKGVMLVADFSSGVGYLPAQTTEKDDGRGPGRDRGLFIGGIEDEHHIVFFPSSAILASIDKWPSAFFARGLWCYAASLEGEMEAYRRTTGPKELVVVRAPHPFASWPDVERARTIDRMIAYGRAVVAGRPTVPGTRPWSNMKELVATSDDVWEPSTKPTLVP